MYNKIQIRDRHDGSVIFEYEIENNTIKKTVIAALKNGLYLINADLRGADLRWADLSGAVLNCSDLRDANLSHANLKNASLRFADLRGVEFTGVNIMGADLICAQDVPYIPLACPSDGSFVAWKKVIDLEREYLVKLEIPEDARRSSATSSKCRCDKAKVLRITLLSNNEDVTEVVNRNYRQEVIYRVGEMVYPDMFDKDRWVECSNGIHFFINKQEAIDY